MESVLVAFGITEWMCIAIAMHISTGFSVNICFCNSSNVGEIFPIYNSRYTGKFSNMLFLERRRSWPWWNHCGRGTEHHLWKSLTCNSLSTWMQPVILVINMLLFVNSKKTTRSSYCWNKCPDGPKFLFMSLKFFITSSAKKRWYWSSWYTRFLGDFVGKETREVTDRLKNSGSLDYFD